MPTNIPYGDPASIKLQSVGLFAASMARPTIINKLAGKMPTQSDAEGQLRWQSSPELPIVRCRDLSKKAGEEITFDLINPMKGKPIMGGEVAEGRGYAMSLSQDQLRINQARIPVSAGDTMTQQRTPHQMRKLAMAQALNLMTSYEDLSALVHLAGARGFADDIGWNVPLASDPDFAKIMINTVKAPTYNRHFMSTGSGVEHIAASGGEVSLASGDVMNTDVMDALRTILDGMALPIPPVRFPDDQAAYDDPMRILLVSSEQYTSIVKSTSFRTLQSNAMARAQIAKGNPLFMGEVGLWNGILVKKMPKPIRFYAGNAINYCASATSETETTSNVVPAAFGTTYAVDRAILLGGQSLAEGYGSYAKEGMSTNNPYFWSEKKFDHEDKLEVLIGSIFGKSKIRFKINHGNQEEYTDFGVIAIDTTVALTGA